MLPDVVDDFAISNPSCKDFEPLLFSCYAFCNKLGGGLSVGISTMTLQWVILPSTSFLMCVGYIQSVWVCHIFSFSIALWATEQVRAAMMKAWWQLLLYCFHLCPSHYCWWGWCSSASTQSTRSDAPRFRNCWPQCSESFCFNLTGI